MTKMIKLHVENIHDITPEDGHVAENCPEKSADGSCALETCDPGTGIAVLNSADVEDEPVPSSGGNAEDGNSSGMTVDESSTAPGNDGTINEKCFINILDPGEDLVTENCSKRSADGSCALEACDPGTGIAVLNSADVEDEPVPSSGGNAEDGNSSGMTVDESSTAPGNDGTINEKCFINILDPGEDLVTENCSKRSADGSCAMDAYILDTGITVQSSATVDDELVPSPGGNAEDGNPSGTTVNECRAVVVNKTRALANMMSLSVQEPARNVLSKEWLYFFVFFSSI
jgi:hypothetical protein